jgi:hypothetical protein
MSDDDDERIRPAVVAHFRALVAAGQYRPAGRLRKKFGVPSPRPRSDRERGASVSRYKRWAAAHPEQLRAYWRSYWALPENAARAAERARRKAAAEKADPVRHAKRLASWAAYRARKRAERNTP